jgi:phosphoketolase
MTARRAYRQEERSLQAEVMLRLRAWPIIAIPIPNGIWLPARTEAEKTLAARLIHTMKAMGMLTPGAFDLSLHWCDGSALVELKTERGKLSDEQRAFAERAEHCGVRWAVVRSWDEMHARLVEWQVPVV